MMVLFITVAILNAGASIYFSIELQKQKGWGAFWAFLSALINAFISATFIEQAIKLNG